MLTLLRIRISLVPWPKPMVTHEFDAAACAMRRVAGREMEDAKGGALDVGAEPLAVEAMWSAMWRFLYRIYEYHIIS